MITDTRIMLLKVAAVISTNPLQNTPDQAAQQAIALGAAAPMEHATQIQALPKPPTVKPLPPATQVQPSKTKLPPAIVTKHGIPGRAKPTFSNPYSEEISRRRESSGLAKRTGDVQVAGLKTTTRSIV